MYKFVVYGFIEVQIDSVIVLLKFSGKKILAKLKKSREHQSLCVI